MELVAISGNCLYNILPCLVVCKEEQLPFLVLLAVARLSSLSHYLNTLTVMLLSMSAVEKEEMKCLKYCVISQRLDKGKHHGLFILQTALLTGH